MSGADVQGIVGSFAERGRVSFQGLLYTELSACCKANQRCEGWAPWLGYGAEQSQAIMADTPLKGK